jgi:hypothetical protein
MSLFRSSVVARNPKEEARATLPIGVLVDAIAHRFVAVGTMTAGSGRD